MTNTLWAYVEAGENLDVVFSNARRAANATDATITVRGPGGEAHTCSVTAAIAPGSLSSICNLSNLTSTTTGVWRIDFAQAPGTITADYYSWSINVQDGTANNPGRVWSTKYMMAQQNQTQRAK